VVTDGKPQGETQMTVRTVEVAIADLRRALDANRNLIEAVKALSELADRTADQQLAQALRRQISKILDSAEIYAQVVVSAASVPA
jgi:predicted component of type VI protein secretion system